MMSELEVMLDGHIARLGEMKTSEVTAFVALLERAFIHATIEQTLRSRDAVSERHLNAVER